MIYEVFTSSIEENTVQIIFDDRLGYTEQLHTRIKNEDIDYLENPEMVYAEIVDVNCETAKKGSIATDFSMSSSLIIINEKLNNIFESEIKNCGFSFPITVHDTDDNYFGYHINKIVPAIIRTETDEFIEVKINKSITEFPLLFKASEYGRIYCNEAFKSAFEAHNFTGIEFKNAEFKSENIFKRKMNN